MDQIQHKYVNINGLKLHFTEAGTGEKVVLFLHDFLEIWYSWRHQMIAMAKAGYRTIAPDFRGYGESEIPSEPENTTFKNLVDDVIGILDFLPSTARLYFASNTSNDETVRCVLADNNEHITVENERLQAALFEFMENYQRGATSTPPSSQDYLQYICVASRESLWVIEVSAIMVNALGNGGGKPLDWQDFIGIVVLLIINSTINFIEENNTGNATAALMAGLAPKTRVIRNGKWSEQEAAILVLGDVISIKLGDIVPADARLLDGDTLKIDQSAITGESLPITKNPGAEIFSGFTCKQGVIEVVVIATGVHTFFGKAVHLVDSTNQVGYCDHGYWASPSIRTRCHH